MTTEGSFVLIGVLGGCIIIVIIVIIVTPGFQNAPTENSATTLAASR